MLTVREEIHSGRASATQSVRASQPKPLIRKDTRGPVDQPRQWGFTPQTQWTDTNNRQRSRRREPKNVPDPFNSLVL